jgi:hypothetical protein
MLDGSRSGALALTLLSAVWASGCASGPNPHWRAGIVPLEERAAAPAKRPEDVQIFYKQRFGTFESTHAKKGFSCDSVTLLRRSELVPGRDVTPRPDRGRIELAELTTEEFPRDEEKSQLKGQEFGRVFGIGTDEFDLFSVVPSQLAIERGVRRLRELAADLGADAVEEVFVTTYAEHQMWQGFAISLNPISTSSPIYVDVRLSDFKLRDVRLHGVAVIYEKD